MPIYEYACQHCGKITDVLQKMSDPPPGKCEHCGTAGSLSKVVSRTSFVLKGGGWYADLYGSSKKETSSTAPKPASSSGESATAPAPASTPSTSTAPAASTSGSSGGSSGSGGSSDKK